MDTFRYVFAVVMVISFPPALAYWYLIHPFVGFWRRLGPRVTFSVLTVFFLGSCAALYLVKDALVGADYGTTWGLVAAGVPLIGIAGVIGYQRKRYLTFKILAGVPEIAPGGEGPGLLTEGIYGRIRHPRYVEALLGAVGWSLILNYFGVYVMTAVAVVGILAVVFFEERELRDRFGEEYVDYCARVPRFIPRLGPR